MKRESGRAQAPGTERCLVPHGAFSLDTAREQFASNKLARRSKKRPNQLLREVAREALIREGVARACPRHMQLLQRWPCDAYFWPQA